MATIIFGSNGFSSNTNFTVLGKTQDGGLVLGGFGSMIDTPLVWINIVNGVGLLNANISDQDGELVLKIENNVITINKDNIYKTELTPDNQIPPDRIVVINQYGETALDLSNDNGVIRLNLDLYHGNDHIVATDEGTYINPDHPFV